MMTGESRFFLTKKERENMKKYLKSGGFLLASAGCSNKEWDKCFRREMKIIYSDKTVVRSADGKSVAEAAETKAAKNATAVTDKKDGKVSPIEKGKTAKKDAKIRGLKKIKMDHPLFKTVAEIKKLKLHHAAADALLEGVEEDGKLVVIYSPHGLNDTAHTEGCCCCGGNEIENSLAVNINIFVYALLH
jgi:hypothetical protein